MCKTDKTQVKQTDEVSYINMCKLNKNRKRRKE